MPFNFSSKLLVLYFNFPIYGLENFITPMFGSVEKGDEGNQRRDYKRERIFVL